jgi:hypothetical protein
VKHSASSRFWDAYEALPANIRARADDAFATLKRDPSHPSLHFKKVGRFWSASVDLRHRALAVQTEDGFLWFWIGDHAGYDWLLGG